MGIRTIEYTCLLNCFVSSTVIDDWEKKYGAGTGWQVIEPVDGFHPNQVI